MIFGMSYLKLLSMVHCQWLRQFFCVFTIAFPGFGVLVLPLMVYVHAWGTTQAVMGWCQTEAPGAVAWTQLPRDPQRKVSLGAVGQIIP